MGNLGSIPRLGRYPGEGKGYPLQYSGLENSMGCIVHGVAKSRMRLNNFHFQRCIMELVSEVFVGHCVIFFFFELQDKRLQEESD